MSRCPKKIVKDCIFASFQGDLACSWSEKNARNSFSTYLASTLHFGLHGVLFEFVDINYAIFFLTECVLETVLNVWRVHSVFCTATM